MIINLPVRTFELSWLQKRQEDTTRVKQFLSLKQSLEQGKNKLTKDNQTIK